MSCLLFEFAKVLDVPVSHFFDEMPANALTGRPIADAETMARLARHSRMRRIR